MSLDVGLTSANDGDVGTSDVARTRLALSTVRDARKESGDGSDEEYGACSDGEPQTDSKRS